ncbi:MAG: hypothetical protein IJT94_09050 [Oscillibacter sp.]|nr:hypothetical protein [Oscillibacter sp.]
MNESENTQGMEPQAATEAVQTEPADSAGTGTWEEDTILPDGWKEGDPPLLSETDFTNAGESDTGTGETAVQAEGGTADGTTNPAGGTSDTAAQTNGLKGTEPEPDYKVLYQAEMARQEAERERQNAEKYRAIVRDMMEREGVPEPMAKAAAANECGGKNYPLSDDAPEAGQAATPTTPGQQVDYGAAIRRIHDRFPGAREMPAQVTEAILRGEDPVGAYAAVHAEAMETESRNLREENARLRSQLDAVRRAPVRGVTGTDAQQKPKSDFEQGFDAAFE